MCMFLDCSGKHWHTVNVQTPHRVKAWAKTESEPFCSGCILFTGYTTIKLSNQDAHHMVDVSCWQQPESSILIKSCNVLTSISPKLLYNWIRSFFFLTNSYIAYERSTRKMKGDNVRWMLKFSLQSAACFFFLAHVLMLVCVWLGEGDCERGGRTGLCQ